MRPMSEEEARTRLDALSQSKLQLNETVLCALINVCAYAWDNEAGDHEIIHHLEVINTWLGIDLSCFSRPQKAS